LKILIEEFEAHPMGYWTSEKGHNMRVFMEDLARSMGKDPLDPETWYSIPRRVVEETKVCLLLTLSLFPFFPGSLFLLFYFLFLVLVA
jgi:hypothetical protein